VEQVQNIVAWIRRGNQALNDIVWGPVMLALMIGIGLYFSIRTGWLPIRRWKLVWRSTLGGLFQGGNREEGDISPFQASATALAGTMGTGNIVGVATALVAGGAGAVFWMWVSALFGMMTKYAEIVLAVQFRVRNERGEVIGGPMYYIEKGLKQKWLAVLFACFCTLASFGIGNMTQVNAMAQTLHSAFHVDALVTGIVSALLASFVIVGGVTRIAKVTSALIPALSLFYMVGSLLAIGLNWNAVPQAFALIFREAFSLKAAGGGVLGYAFMNALRFGVARGVFSNEAGLGSAPIAHAASKVKSPVEQGMWGIFEVFADTIVVCTLTALVILTSGVFGTEGLDGADLTTAAFAETLGSFAGTFLSVAVTLFAFATLIGWYYYGERSVEYLCKRDGAVKVYRLVYLILILLGAMMELKLVWSISDTLNGLMAIPNLIALVGLSGVVLKTTREFVTEKRVGNVSNRMK